VRQRADDFVVLGLELERATQVTLGTDRVVAAAAAPVKSR